MNEWGWPEYVTAAWLLFQVVYGVAKDVAKDSSTKNVWLSIAAYPMATVATVYILHAGGFW